MKQFSFASLLLALLLSFTSCSNDSDGAVESEFTNQKICQNVAEVVSNVLAIDNNCKSIKELSEHLDEIRNLKNVEDAYVTNTSMFVQIKDFSTISFSYYPERKVVTDDQKQYIGEITRSVSKQRRAMSYPPVGQKKVGIAFQMSKDEKGEDVKEAVNYTKDRFNIMGFNISENLIMPTVDFFKNGISDYDILYINTHGHYEEKTGLHWLATSEEVDGNVFEKEKESIVSDDKELYEAAWNRILNNIFTFTWTSAKRIKYRYKGSEYYEDEFGIDFKLNEKRDGKRHRVAYFKISEKFIERNVQKLKNDAIILNTACQSMKGHEQGDTVSYSMAKAFIEKGAAAYLGYDEENDVNAYAGALLFSRLLSGMSLKNSIESLPFWAKHDHNRFLFISWWADLISYIPQKEKENMTLFTPLIVGGISESNEGEITYEVVATTFLDLYNYIIDYNSKKDEIRVHYCSDIPNNSPIRYGFELCETSDFKNSFVDEMYVGQDGCFYDKDYGIVFMRQKYKWKAGHVGDKIKPNTLYYVRAYFYDGYDKYYSETNKFTTPKLKNGKNTGEGDLPVIPGTDF